MKRYLNFLTLLSLLLVFNSCTNGDDDGLTLDISNPPSSVFSPCEDGEDIDAENLPQAIQDYIADNYANYTVDDAEQFFNDIRYGVEISLGDDDNEIELLFTEDGVLLNSGDDDDDEVTVALDALPSAILDYIDENYSSLSITLAELELEYGYRFYEIGLGDDIELYFSEDGAFLCRDDDGDDDDGDDDDDNGDDDDDGGDDDDDNGDDDDDDDDDDNGDDDDDDDDNIPGFVSDYIQANYPGAEVDDIEEERLCDGTLVIEVELEDENTELYFDTDGNFLFSATEIDEQGLPQAVTDAIATEFPGYQIDDDGDDDIEELQFEDGTTQYWIELDAPGDEDDIEVVFAENGSLLCP